MTQLSYLTIFLAANWQSVMAAPSIAWNQKPEWSKKWVFHAPPSESSGNGILSNTVTDYDQSDCRDSDELPRMLLEWMRESYADPYSVQFVPDLSIYRRPNNLTDTTFGRLLVEPAICGRMPSTDATSDMMERSLCPWEWIANQDEMREPKLISEANCICRQSRGPILADCAPIRRKTPVIRRVYCDKSVGFYKYRRSYEMVTVGCHSVMPKISRGLQLSDWESTQV